MTATDARNKEGPRRFGPKFANFQEALLPAHRNGQPWSREDLERLRELATERRSVNAIADILERTPIGIRSKAMSLGLKLGPSKGARGEESKGPRSGRVGGADDRLPASHERG